MEQTNQLQEVREYTQEYLDNNKNTEVLTKYISVCEPLEEQIREITGEKELKFVDFVAHALKIVYSINVKPKNLSRNWNNRSGISERIKRITAQMNATSPVYAVADLNKLPTPKDATQEQLNAFYEYAKQCRNVGIEWQEIHANLLNAGWKKELVDFYALKYGNGDTKPVLKPFVAVPPPTLKAFIPPPTPQ